MLLNFVGYILNRTTTGTLAETWSEVWGDEVGVLAPNFFLPTPPKCEIWGDGGGLTVFVNFKYLTHGFCVYIVDFVDFNI